MSRGDSEFLDGANGLQHLQDILASSYGVELTGWSLTKALALSTDGTTLVGYGTHYGQTEAWIATVPEPSLGITFKYAAR